MKMNRITRDGRRRRSAGDFRRAVTVGRTIAVKRIWVGGLLLLVGSLGASPARAAAPGVAPASVRTVHPSPTFERSQPTDEARPDPQAASLTYEAPLRLQAVAGGGSAGASALLEGSAGQIGSAVLVGAAFRIDAGFWPAARAVVFIDGFETGDPSSWSAAVP
jgi:hypothetical protein